MSRWDSPSFNSALAGEALGRGPLSPFFFASESQSLYESNNALDPSELGAPAGGTCVRASADESPAPSPPSTPNPTPSPEPYVVRKPLDAALL